MMKVEAHDIDKQELVRLLNAEYHLDVMALTFVPEGEDSYSYIAETPVGRHYFVKVHVASHAAGLQAAFQVAYGLHKRCGLRFVVHPRRTRNERLTCTYGRYVVAVFPFIERSTALHEGLTDDDLPHVAAMLASLHTSVRCPALSSLAAETFEVPYADRLLHILEAVEALNLPANEYQREVGTLLTRERADILATLELLERLGVLAHIVGGERVLTHGDPNPSNVLKDTQDRLYLLDWNDVALGPPERDLSFFTGERFEPFLVQYVQAYGQPLRLNEDIFAFYIYRWIVQEIADYSARILFGNMEHVENEHAWEELLRYLPIRHQSVQIGLREIRDVIHRVVGG